MIYFPTNGGAKEPQNLPNHKVVVFTRDSFLSIKRKHVSGKCSRLNLISFLMIVLFTRFFGWFLVFRDVYYNISTKNGSFLALLKESVFD